MTAVTATAARGFRVARHHLDEPVPAVRLVDVVRDVCGVHAQVASSAELALAARIEGLQRGDVHEALEARRTLVKTWMPRGTLHLLAGDDLPLYAAVMSDRRPTADRVPLARRSAERERVRAIVEALASVLDETPRTRKEVADLVAARAGPELRPYVLSKWGEYLKPSAHRGELCFGPKRGGSVTFVRPDRWLGRAWDVDAEGARREVARRYLRAYGPATPESLARWIGRTPRQAERLLGTLGDELAEVDLDGTPSFALRADLPHLRRAHTTPVRLLPAFDPYVVGFKPRRLLVDPVHEPRIFRPQGWISPVALVDGRAAGVWKHELRRRVLEIRVEPFAGLPRTALAGLDAERDRLGEFLGAPAGLEICRPS